MEYKETPEPIKVLGICGSPRKAATEMILRRALDIASEMDGVSCQFEHVARTKMNPCIHCNRCLAADVLTCPVFPDDGVSRLYDSVREADVLVMATPVYQMAPSAQIQVFMNRLRPLGKLMSRGEWGLKTGVGIAVGGKRNGGEETAIDVLNRFFLSQGMCIAGGGVFSYNGAAVWSQNTAEAAEMDEVGEKTLRISIRRAVVVARLLKSGRAQHPEMPGVEIAGFRDERERQMYTAAFRSQASD